MAPERKHKSSQRTSVHKDIGRISPVSYFDGAFSEGECGCEAQIELGFGQSYHCYWSGGEGTNSRAEMLDLWGVLQCAFWLAIEDIVVAGDSKSVIEWAKGRHSFRVPFLHH